jgi:RNA polymerase sigma factor (sigma-70 family)
MTSSDPRHAVADRASMQRTIQAVWHIESAKIIAKLVRIVRDVGVAEELAQDALVVALEQWPIRGIPDNPAAWLMTIAKNRAIDQYRRSRLIERKNLATSQDPDAVHDSGIELERAVDEDIADDLLRLMFIACHPVLSAEARVALTLRLLGGLTTEEIARAFLASEPTIQQRIVRAKRTLSEARVPFELPRVEERPARLASVLEVIYLIFNEGYAATSGEHWLRPALCEEALRLGRILAELASQEVEVHGLVALMEIQSSRNRARLGPDGEPILLMEQNRSQWDPLLISRGLASLARAQALAETFGPYALQASIAACHARAKAPEDTDWVGIVALYDALSEIAPSPVVTLNRAVAISRGYGPEAAMAIVDSLQEDKRLDHYHLLPSVRGDLLEKLGRLDESRAEYVRAAALTQNGRERRLLLARAAACEAKARRPD